ncbi:MAG: hypothetical protein IT355_14670 [Gemmatimonadaceae bacterium]|nr:hypothetical protein [Gemmatimonadaceae bacterium]
MSAPAPSLSLGTSVALALGCGVLLRLVVQLEPVAWLAWVAPVPALVLASRSPHARTRWLMVLAALVAQSGNLSALTRIMPAGLAIGVSGALALVLAGILNAAQRHLRHASVVPGMLALPLLWTAVDTVMAHALPDGNWNSYAYTQVGMLPLLQVTSILGVPGLLFVLTLVPSAIAFVLLHGRRPRGTVRACIAVMLTLAVTMAFGAARLRQRQAGPSVTIGLVAIDDAIGLQARAPYIGAIRSAYAARVAELAAQGARLVVLPEKIAVTTPAGAGEWQRYFSDLAAAQRVGLLASITIDGGGPPENFAWLFGADGRLDDAYLKHHLAPPERAYRAGTNFAVRDVSGFRAGLAICKDMHFASFAREYGARDVAVVLVPAWDFTVDRTLAARMTMVRGVENGFMVIRSSRDGLLTVSSAYGRVIAERPSAGMPGAGLLVTTVVPPPIRTVYTRFGDWFGWLCVAGAAVLLVAGRRRLRALTG